MIDVDRPSEIVHVRTPKFYDVRRFIKLKYDEVFVY